LWLPPLGLATGVRGELQPYDFHTLSRTTVELSPTTTGHQARFEPINPTRPYGNPKPCERMFEIPVLGFASPKKGRFKAHRTNGRSSPTTATRSSCHRSTPKVAIITT